MTAFNHVILSFSLSSLLLLSLGCSGNAGDDSNDATPASDVSNDGNVAMPITFVRIEGGRFQMGDSINGYPVHSVSVPTFEMSRSEVTIGQYRTCVDAGVCRTPANDWSDTPNGLENHPVVWVSYDDAVTFATFVNARLPSESEWEYAARSEGQDISYPWGNEYPTCALLNFADCVGTTTAVCSYPEGRTAQGLCDMAGNVYEWVADDYHRNYEGAPDDGSPWIDMPRNERRVFRDGSWDRTANSIANAERDYGEVGNRYNGGGFRLAR